MNCEDKIIDAHSILMRDFAEFIIETQLDIDECLLKIILTNAMIIYITFNSHDEYSYQCLFSFNYLDRERFDNYDKNWNVSSSPHHFHLRFSNKVSNSDMNGYPKHDIPILIKYFKQFL